MGNVPTKLEDSNSSSHSSSNSSIKSRRNSNAHQQYHSPSVQIKGVNNSNGGGNGGGRRNSHAGGDVLARGSLGNNSNGNRRRGSSLVGSLLAGTHTVLHPGSGTPPSGSSLTNKNPFSKLARNRRYSTRERQRMKEQHYRGLVVMHDEVVDGGYMAPYGCHDEENKLDYKDDIVRNLILERKLQPFYLPLNDYDSEWDDVQLLKIIKSLTLHEPYLDNLEKFEDLPGLDVLDGTGNNNSINMYNDDIEKYLDPLMSKNEKKVQRSRIFAARLYKMKIMWQEQETELYLNEKFKSEEYRNPMIPNDQLYLDMYRNGTECPICFLYYPAPFNISRCCDQPICTECFVQIKRKDPHFPHLQENNDDKTTKEKNPTQVESHQKKETEEEEEEEEEDETLISEVASCPYCATPNFGIVYTAPLFYRRCGMNSVHPRDYTGQQLKGSINGSNTMPTTDDVIIEEEDDDNKDISPTESNANRGMNRRLSLPVTHERVVSCDTIRPDWEVKLNKARDRLKKKYEKATTIHVNNRLVGQSDISKMEDDMIKKAIELSLQGQTTGKK